MTNSGDLVDVKSLLSSDAKLKEFDEFYKTRLKSRLTDMYAGEPACVQKVIDRFDYMMDYNVPHGKKLRGLCVYESFLNLVADKQVTLLEIEQAKAVGWCVEFLQASFLVADDIMDNSTMRRGQPCWYLNKDVGNIAINDTFYLLAFVYKIIGEFVPNHPMYPKFYELFTKSLINTVIGQGLDLVTPPPKSASEFDFTNYTQEQYDSIVKWKTAFYSFSLPVQSALYLAGIDSTEIHNRCEQILLEMGHYFQVQDDYLDCYGDPKVTGKVGTDIEESKCGWLVIQALRKANSEQLELLKANYGKSDAESVSKVKHLYNELKLDDEYKQFEQSKYEKIIGEIDALSIETHQLSQIKECLRAYTRKIFKRNK